MLPKTSLNAPKTLPRPSPKPPKTIPKPIKNLSFERNRYWDANLPFLESPKPRPGPPRASQKSPHTLPKLMQNQLKNAVEKNIVLEHVVFDIELRIDQSQIDFPLGQVI